MILREFEKKKRNKSVSLPAKKKEEKERKKKWEKVEKRKIANVEKGERDNQAARSWFAR